MKALLSHDWITAQVPEEQKQTSRKPFEKVKNSWSLLKQMQAMTGIPENPSRSKWTVLAKRRSHLLEGQSAIQKWHEEDFDLFILKPHIIWNSDIIKEESIFFLLKAEVCKTRRLPKTPQLPRSYTRTMDHEARLPKSPCQPPPLLMMRNPVEEKKEQKDHGPGVPDAPSLDPSPAAEVQKPPEMDDLPTLPGEPSVDSKKPGFWHRKQKRLGGWKRSKLWFFPSVSGWHNITSQGQNKWSWRLMRSQADSPKASSLSHFEAASHRLWCDR